MWNNPTARIRAFIPKTVQHIQQYAFTWVLLLTLIAVIQANYKLAINQTPSLPYKLYLIHLNDQPVTGGLIAFVWRHGKPYHDGTIFVKRLLASGGEKVVRHNRDFFVGNRLLLGKDRGMTGRQLFPNNQLHDGENIIPLDRYFVAGDHEYSLDSRYSLLGLVTEKEVIGRAYPIF